MMVTLEQVKLLETKVVKAIDYVRQLSDENALLRQKLEGYQNRIGELEVLVEQFKADQSHIEAGIVSALNRLNQFEDTLEQGAPTAIAASPSEDDILAALEAEEAAARAAEILAADPPEPAAELDIF
jgi:hypothetical protein